MEVFDLIHHQFVFPAWSVGETNDHITVVSTSYTADVSACCCRYSLCGVWVYHEHEGYSYVFSRWISREILPFHSDRLYYCKSHCTNQLHIMRWVILPPPRWCYSPRSVIIGAPQSLSPLLSLDCRFNISFSAWYHPLCWRFSSRLGAPQSCPWPRLEVPLFHSTLICSRPVRCCLLWMGCFAR